ncbi:heme-binding protein [Chromobacterium sp. ATCC 53434]|uniref:GlcG/HbpS family heme-binding protein n=1 Tax=Chromobacterium sp. (strain ATCC 53434 / SC 14030) TaxID=2059672 RepID=UPI0013050AFF|nr:heme-binding protein [Chromobacterium sp. ATCC 53434]
MSVRTMKIECDGAVKRGFLRKATMGLAWFGIASTLSVSACGQTLPAPGGLPLSLAMDAVGETVRVCEAKGLKVAVTIVDPDGVIKLQARGDGSPIHSQEFSYRKAYTVMSMGPMQGVDSNSALIGKVSPAASNGASILLMLPGAVLLKQNGQAIAAIGVSGAPKSLDDEACAQAGIDKIKGRL